LYDEITALIKSICTSDPPIVIKRLSVFQLVNTLETRMAIGTMEYLTPCCFETTIMFAGPIFEGFTKEGICVTVDSGDIEKSHKDVIINTANPTLSHNTGLAFALLQQGGPIIQEDSKKYIKVHGTLSPGDAIITDKIGKLHCKRIIHAVGPNWTNGTDYEIKLFKNVCLNSLHLATDYKTIAFPACPATGNWYKFPIDVYANTLIQTICEWSKEYPYSNLQYINVLVGDIKTDYHASAAFTDAVSRYLNVIQTSSSSFPGIYFRANVHARSSHSVEKAKNLFMSYINHSCDSFPLTNIREAVLLQQKIKWKVLSENGQYTDYGAEHNYCIEQAYQLHKKWKEKPTFTYRGQLSTYIINFDSDPMQEKDCKTGDLKTVQRIDNEGTNIYMQLIRYVCVCIS